MTTAPPAPDLLALRALKLGDFLTGLPALRALGEGLPGHRRVLAAPSWLAPLVRLADAADVLAPAVELEPFRPPRRPEVAVDLHGRGPESQRLLLEHEPDQLIAFCHPDVPATDGGPTWRRDEHEVARWCRLLAESGVPADPDRLGLPVPPPPPGSVGLEGVTVVHPGAASAARRWPPERFAAAARALEAGGRRVVVTGSSGERQLAERVADEAGLPPARVLAGGTGLTELAWLVAHAEQLVSGDTGVAHLATAYGTPSVVLFGPVPPAWWGPPPSDRHVALWRGALGDPHAAAPDRGLLEIELDEVLEALRSLPDVAPVGDRPPGEERPPL